MTRSCSSRTAHRACDTVQLLQQETTAFISPDLWPPNSPDLNPVDYRIWGLMQQHLYKTPFRDTIDLKKRLVDTWASIPQCVVDEAVDQWTLDSTATRMREGKRLPVRTSAPVINRFFSEPPDPHHNRLFSEPPTFSRRKHVTGVQYRLRVNL